jgi:hypothetical protein
MQKYEVDPDQEDYEEHPMDSLIKTKYSLHFQRNLLVQIITQVDWL